LLHGFNFYKLFLFHQIIHVSQQYDVVETEVETNPESKEECINFIPLPEFNFANDFINFTFWSHKPNAFDHEEEIAAFVQTVIYGESLGYLQDKKFSWQ